MQIPSLRRKQGRSPRTRLVTRAPDKPADALCDDLRQYLDERAVRDVYNAYLYAAQAHKGQRRRSGEPYIYHPVAVAQILAELKLDVCSIVAAILHDVMEDTPIGKDELEAEFGADVAHLVDGVSKIGQIDFDSKEHAEAENFRKMLMAMSQDIRVILIKLADRIHNMRTLDAMPPPKQRDIARQTMDIYAAIANRLGLYQWSRELEDLSFLHLYPKRHQAIAKMLRKRQGNRKSVVKKLKSQIERELKSSSIEAMVIGRKKNVYSIYKKMLRKHKSFDELHDIYGFRIVVRSLDDCYRVLGVIHNLYKPIPGRFRDYIAIPKTNGYQSLHTVVFGTFGESLEVQVRNEDMNRIAEAGIAAHWIYKSDGNGSSSVNAQQLARQWLLDLLDTQKESGNPSEFLEHLKVDLFPDEVYVFTHQGDIKKLPRGATALDFAYAVHTDLGNACAGVRVNRELVSLPTVLNNGDHVEIITSNTARPTVAWLNYIVTGKARATIRHYLKKQRGYEAVKLGKRLLDHAVKNRRFRKRRLNDEQKQSLLKDIGANSWDDLLQDIGLGKRLPSMVARQIVPVSQSTKGGSGEANESLAIDGAEGMLITYAKCCHPVPGDNIVGFFTAGRGVVVHTFDCPNNTEYRKQPDKWVHVTWAQHVKGDFAVNLRIDTENKRGVLANVATAIAERGSNINNVNVEERDGRFSTIRFTIQVRDRVHLAAVLRKIRRVAYVTKVARTKG